MIVKMPRWNFDKFKGADDTLGLQMKSVGEVMAIGRTFPEALQKACQSLENDAIGLGYYGKSLMRNEQLIEKLKRPTWDRVFRIKDALMEGNSVKKIHEMTYIDRWFLNQINDIVLMEKKLMEYELNDVPELLLKDAKTMGFSDKQLAHFFGNCDEQDVYEKRKSRASCVPIRW
ncbi:hypothetical protein MKQ70_29195 [Chitinophaga sedimenti]|uniref:hypothetical protein n=1 Tax=Chitinophaga sedimenti TaxID=2033606 RepID=UPI002004BB95|nr:hypothetical protein [Chitinophaga sedimenti]MCK7558838.1 hypothetical protein [Chitinophaga sedimenti]